MQQDKLISICNQFLISDSVVSLTPITSGHINDTFLVVCDNNKKFVLQKLNTNVFNDYENVIQNKVLVSNYLSEFYEQTNSDYKTIEFIKSKSESFYLKDNNSVWMLMTYIENSQVFDKATNRSLVREAGKLYGNFISCTQSLHSSKIKETLPDFHSVPLRLNQFKNALKTANKRRIKQACIWIDLVNKHGSNMSKLWHMKEDGVLPTRITHNDTKLSNILFSKTKPSKGLAVIDLDTVMPGLVHFDFGDSIRSICSSTTEDDDNLKNVHLNLEFYKAYCKGFAQETKRILTQSEIQYLPLGAQTLIFIMGLRFLTDFLNNDTYYKTAYPNHNLVRASNQFTLFNSLLENINEVDAITENAFKSHNIS